jgi:protein TonB
MEQVNPSLGRCQRNVTIGIAATFLSVGAALSAGPPATAPSYTSTVDYPAAALRAREQGTAGFRLTIGADGQVTACTITSSSGSAILDAETCRIMQTRARFRPAHDSNGNPIVSTVNSRIRWVLPN